MRWRARVGVLLLLAGTAAGQVRGPAAPRGAERLALPDRPTVGDPIDLSTGLYLRTDVDLQVSDTLPIVLERTYRNQDNLSRSFGIGASHSFAEFLVGDAGHFGWIDVVLADGERISYQRSPGTPGLDFVFVEGTDPFRGSTLSYLNPGNKWRLTLKDGSLYLFLACSPKTTHPEQCGFIEYHDSRGATLYIARDDNGNATRITSPHGRWIDLTYDKADRVVKATESAGHRSVTYRYDAKGRLVEVHRADGKVQRYAYDAHNNMVDIDEFGYHIHNRYDVHDMCVEQTISDGMRFTVHYEMDSTQRVRQAVITQFDAKHPQGVTDGVSFDPKGYIVQENWGVGRPEQVVLSYVYDPKDHSLKSAEVECTGAEGRRVHQYLPILLWRSRDTAKAVATELLTQHCQLPPGHATGRRTF